MKTGNVFRPSLDDRAGATVRLGRELSRLAEADFPVDGPDAASWRGRCVGLPTAIRLIPATTFPSGRSRAIPGAELGGELADTNRRSIRPAPLSSGNRRPVTVMCAPPVPMSSRNSSMPSIGSSLRGKPCSIRSRRNVS
jgi:hypothetical protein